VFVHIFIYRRSVLSNLKDLCDCRVIHLDKVNRAREESLSAETTENLCQTFKALGDNTRLKIMWALAKQEMCVCDLAAMLDVSESAVSHQLRLLRTLRLVTNRRQGTILYYSLADEHVSQLIQVALEHVNE
jgi:DNA-binding transcriptional ArsR family regulator